MIKPKPPWLTDYLDIWSELTEEEQGVWEAIHDFVEKEWLKPKKGTKESLVVECTRSQRFPQELIPLMADVGFLGATLPPEYGGAGLGPVAYGIMNYELERGDSALRSFVSVTNGLVCFPILTFGTEEQKRFWLPKICRGEKIGCFGLTADGGGSNPAGQMKNKAVRDGRSFILNGSNYWITNGGIADVVVLFARLDNDIQGFLVEKGTPGFDQQIIKDKASLPCSVTGKLIFTDCRIPAENLMPGAKGKKGFLLCLNEARYGISWGAVGAAAGCYETALAYAKSRVVFPPKPIAGYQLIQKNLVDMLEQISYAQTACLRLGRLKERGMLQHQQISLLKRGNVAMARRAAPMAREILGASGISIEYPPIRHMVNMESVYTYEGTHEIHTLIIGKDITGCDAFE